ncbi:MAG: glutamine--fructose-6-phosphate transaminase (isomerizing) [Candidatus Omnitrophica bacterium]|nr:glutamine--fructose-6-phosphate transaminase (isomerizing) [Candidatus Omnitrophota bacterium]
MCGIVGYIGKKEAQDMLLNGLKRLEYRGYDSAGICTFLADKKRLSIRKLPGKVKDLEQLLKKKPVSGSLGIGHCLTPETQVFLANGGVIPISEIKDGDTVLSFNLESRKLEPAAVKVTQHAPPPRLYLIRTAFGSIKCTPEHRMFVMCDGKIIEKRADDIRMKDLLIVPKVVTVKGRKIKFQHIFVKRYYKITQDAHRLITSRVRELYLTKIACASLTGMSRGYIDHIFRNDRNFREDELSKLLPALSIPFNGNDFIPQNTIHGKFINLPSESSAELMQLIGYLLGDGTVKERCVRFKDLDKALLESYKDLIRKVFNVEGRIAPMNDTRAWLLEVNSFYLCQWLNQNITYRKNEFVSELCKSPLDEIAAFLRGFFDAEGCVNMSSGQISLRNTNKQLVRISQYLLLRCGIIASFYTEKKKKANWNDSHGLFINKCRCLEKFRSLIGFESRTKSEKLNTLIIEKKRVAERTEYRDLNIEPQPVLEIKTVLANDERLYDLEVDNSHSNFIANGFVSHNSRWATHGAPNLVNAHPHCDCNNVIALVHNGIIENYEQLKLQLIKEGHKFRSQTDTEVIVHLIEKYYRQNSLEEAVCKTLKLLIGSFAIGVIAKKEPNKLIGARLGSPLIIGIGKNENFIASDVPAILEHCKRVVYLKDRQVAVLTPDSIDIYDLNNRRLVPKFDKVTMDAQSAQKGGFAHFMLKEIHEQPRVLERLLSSGLKEIKAFTFPKNIKNIVIVACGTAYHAGLVGKYVIESLARIPVWVDLSSEFRYRDPIVTKDSLVIAVSQSGETADTLAAVREAKKRGAKVISVCNVVGSSLTRESDKVFYTLAGPEIGVASTKAYTAQLAVFYMLGLQLALCRRTITAKAYKRYLVALGRIPALQEKILRSERDIARAAVRHHHFGSFLFLGRNINFPSALEGALKLKEISYIPAEGYAAGEMKHGPIALIDEYRAVVCIAVDSKIYDKMVSNIQEIRARSGKLLAIASEGNNSIKTYVPEVIRIPKCDEFFSPLLVALPLQMLAYYIALERGCNVDQPRNLAKSVTVE